MRRKKGAMLALEAQILEAALQLRLRDVPAFYGFQIARELREGGAARQLTAFGTLYKALERMEREGWLTSDWEDPQAAAAESRPRRRLYRVTSLGEQALARAAASAQPSAGLVPKPEPL